MESGSENLDKRGEGFRLGLETAKIGRFRVAKDTSYTASLAENGVGISGILNAGDIIEITKVESGYVTFKARSGEAMQINLGIQDRYPNVGQIYLEEEI